MTTPTFIIGDVHGHLDNLVGLLLDAGLVNSDLAWAGGRRPAVFPRRLRRPRA